MKAIVVMLVTIAGLSSTVAHAAPPTVVPSPGYDARLQEQRAARSARSGEQITPLARPMKHHHKKRARN
ncbi:hypothetical protein CI1B_17280 [Bradyrhizobium ivorense]|uniref:Uncharacterized protein n=1 Tax=Bradyrhizobium ivorense TaxID=2511166 RepID=A0A508SUE5_9BRAD|nr:hypothetical protein [Bradyrhizobium ivorense]VIO66605.1 hypothetical protein CI1B_17280 [Bradyrhizobium ivorense]